MTRAERAVVLARGLGSRMREADPSAALTETQHRAADAGLKAMMPIGGRPFLDFALSALADAGVRRAALVVAPDHAAIREHYEDLRPSRISIEYAVQERPLGTANAVLAAERWTDEHPFLVLNADNIYPAAVLRSLLAAGEPSFPAFRRADLVRHGNIKDEQVRAFALVQLDATGYLRHIVEKPPPEVVERAGDDAIVSMNCWRFDARIFPACRDVRPSERGELELPQAVLLAVERGVRFRALPADGGVLDLSRRADAADLSRRLADVTPRL